MPYRINTGKKIYIQYTLLDFIEEGLVENVDCRTPEGRRRYKQLFGRRIRGCETSCHACARRMTLDQVLSLSRDAEYLLDIFNERDRRLFAGFLAIEYGCGGVDRAAELTGLDEKTVRKGMMELKTRAQHDTSCIRSGGGGRLSKAKEYPLYEAEIQKMTEDDVAGDPMSTSKWIRKTLRHCRDNLLVKGIKVAASTIRGTFKNLGLSLKKNVKSKNDEKHPDRNEQFEFLNEKKRNFLGKGMPVISCDTKKKELIGNFKNDGRTWREEAYRTLDHDFPSMAEGKLIPFGIYDIGKNDGHVYCGTSHETSEFAVDAIALWWEEVGQAIYRGHDELLILCDSGGANGYRRRSWKLELQTKLADKFGLVVHVCHYPTGASKYNPVEHRLFSYISLNWAGEPLTSYEKALGYISTTTTKKGLKVNARLLDKDYSTGIKVTDEQIKLVSIIREDTCPNWNYIIRPR